MKISGNLFQALMLLESERDRYVSCPPKPPEPPELYLMPQMSQMPDRKAHRIMVEGREIE